MNHVKCLCIKRLKTTYVNSGFQPKLPSCLAETGELTDQKRRHTIKMSLSGKRGRERGGGRREGGGHQ